MTDWRQTEEAIEDAEVVTTCSDVEVITAKPS